VRVLYVSHTAQISGGERSLIELLGALGERVEPTVATPRGDLSAWMLGAGLPVRVISGADGSLKAHPLHTPVAVAQLARAAWSVRRIARRERAQLVHANSIRAGLVAAAAARSGGPPAVVHVRDVLPDGPLTRLTRIAVDRGASAIIGNSAHTLARFAPSRTDTVLAVAHSPVDMRRMRLAAELDRFAARAALDIPPDAGPVLGVVAQLTPWKGQDDAIRLVAHLRERFPGVHLLLAGSAKFVSASTRYDNRGFERKLKSLANDLDLGDRVVLLGERDDVPELLRALDMLLVPSWEEPFGRAIVEALAVGVPVAATSVGGPREILRNGVDGLLLPPRAPGTWAAALSRLLSDPARLSEMGGRGPARAADFDRQAHADRVLSVYERVLPPRPTVPADPVRAPAGRPPSAPRLADQVAGAPPCSDR
jgi:glycosyltransferase involved in cell wall biosynthesis